MTEAALWGCLAACSLLVGAVLAYTLSPSARLVGIIMAFGAGTLLSAVSFEMIGKPVHRGEVQGIALGLLLGSVVYTGGDWAISQLGGYHRTKIESEHAVGAEAGIALGTVLDGVPESFVMGITLSAEGSASLAFIAAVFISNLPEAIASTAGLKRRWSAVAVFAGWTTMVALCALMAALGYAAAQAYSGYSGARIEAFAAGAILTMLATTMMPEAIKQAGRITGVITVLGYILALVLTLAD